jgi:hypothetical protein
MKWMEEETWMNAETAKERGFTDEIASDGEPDEPPVKDATVISILDAHARTQRRIDAMARDLKLLKCRTGQPAAVGASPGK